MTNQHFITSKRNIYKLQLNHRNLQRKVQEALTNFFKIKYTNTVRYITILMFFVPGRCTETEEIVPITTCSMVSANSNEMLKL